jgi:predicted HicB family RNase H-like nuclease
MKSEKLKSVEKKPAETLVKETTSKSTSPKKKKTDETTTTAAKVKKTKSEKVTKVAVASKNQKAPKDDKLIKFLVSMNKSVRKNIKKEAAEAGISMNEYIVLAVEDKLSKDSLNQ